VKLTLKSLRKAQMKDKKEKVTKNGAVWKNNV